MKNALWKIAKAGAIMFAVGFLLAAAMPHIAVAFGFAETAAEAVTSLHIAKPAWLGMFFGTFGAPGKPTLG